MPTACYIEEKSAASSIRPSRRASFGRLHRPASRRTRPIGRPAASPFTSCSAAIEPLELTVYTPQPVPLVVQPRVDNPRRFERELVAVVAAIQRLLAQRAGRRQPAADRRDLPDDDARPAPGPGAAAARAPARRDEARQPRRRSRWSCCFGMERLRLDTLRNTMLGRGDFGEPANLPLPPGRAWSPLALPADMPAVEIEPIADARAARMVLRPLRPLLELPLAEPPARRIRRRHQQHGHAPQLPRPDEQAAAEPARPGAERARRAARRPGHLRRGPRRPRHVHPRRRRDRHPVSGHEHATF